MPKISKKKLEVVNVEDEEDYITARNEINNKPGDKIEDKPEINVQRTLIIEGEKAKLFTPPEDTLEDKIEDRIEDKTEGKHIMP